VTPVGSFRTGASVAGAHDMSGNVWEWTRSHERPYPYQPNDGREYLDADDNVPRMVRSGSFEDDSTYVTAAYRSAYSPTQHLNNLGFRVVISTVSP
jgi:formylglycine-generating enzyme required for sulfatase activity